MFPFFTSKRCAIFLIMKVVFLYFWIRTHLFKRKIDQHHIFFWEVIFLRSFNNVWKNPFLKFFIRRWNWFFYVLKSTPQEKCPYLEFFLVCIFPHLEWIRRFIKWIFVFSPNAGKCTPEKLRIRTIFTQYNTEPSMGLVSSNFFILEVESEKLNKRINLTRLSKINFQNKNPLNLCRTS